MINLKIDPEFQSQIPPLTDDEFKQLEENILKEGKLLSPYSCDFRDTVFLLIRFRTHSRQGRAIVLVSKENKKSEPFSYREKVRIFMVWCDGRDSNPRPTDS